MRPWIFVLCKNHNNYFIFGKSKIKFILNGNLIYLLAEKRFSSKRVAAQEAAALIAPPTIALPTKTAPPTIIGATFASGADAVEKESSVLDSEAIIIIYKILF
jgi:hypothetical protein